MCLSNTSTCLHLLLSYLIRALCSHSYFLLQSTVHYTTCFGHTFFCLFVSSLQLCLCRSKVMHSKYNSIALTVDQFMSTHFLQATIFSWAQDAVIFQCWWCLVVLCCATLLWQIPGSCILYGSERSKYSDIIAGRKMVIAMKGTINSSHKQVIITNYSLKYFSCKYKSCASSPCC